MDPGNGTCVTSHTQKNNKTPRQNVVLTGKRRVLVFKVLLIGRLSQGAGAWMLPMLPVDGSKYTHASLPTGLYL